MAALRSGRDEKLAYEPGGNKDDMDLEEAVDEEKGDKDEEDDVNVEDDDNDDNSDEGDVVVEGGRRELAVVPP